MIKRLLPLTVLLFAMATCTFAQTTQALSRSIEAVLADKRAKVGVYIVGENESDTWYDTLSINGNDRFPMQSVFKFHIALTVLAQVGQGKLSLEQPVTIHEHQLLPGLYSPLREKYPKGADLKLSEILAYTVSQSDNVGCDALLRLVGGPEVVESYIVNKGFKDFSVKVNEEVMQGSWDMQFLNWTTPKAASQVLHAFYRNEQNLLAAEPHEFLWTTMKETGTGINRIKGNLPDGTVVAHKTGWSGTNKEGVTAAVNDIGIVFLPDGRHFVISVFVTDSREDLPTNEKIIADISRLTWDYFTAQRE